VTPYRRRFYQWSDPPNLVAATLGGQDQFFGAPGQPPTYDWPNPRIAVQPQENRGFVRAANVQLLGLDQFFGAPGEAPRFDWPNPPQPRQPAQSHYQTNLWVGLLAQPFAQTDWPNPQQAKQPQENSSFVRAANVQLIGQDRFFAGAGQAPIYDWPNPQRPRQPLQPDTPPTYLTTFTTTATTVLVAATAAASTNSNSVTTTGINTTTATFLICAVATATKILTPANISDSNNNTWLALTNYQTGDSTGELRFFYCFNPVVGGGHTVTVNDNGSFPGVAFAAFSGPLGILDLQNGFGEALFNNAGNTSVQPGSLTPGGNNYLVVSGLSNSSASVSSLAVNQGFNIAADAATVANEGVGVGIAYLVQGTAAAINPTWSGSGQILNAANIVSIGPLAPFYQTNWPNPLAPRLPQENASFLRAASMQLIGQDKFFAAAGQAPVYDWPNPARPRYPVQPETPPNLLTTFIVVAPFVQLDWPNPVAAKQSQENRGFIRAANVQLIGQDKFFGALGQAPAYDWPNPSRPRQPVPPDMPPNLLLTTFIVAAPFYQMDWPNPRVVFQPQENSSFVRAANVQLIGQDRFFAAPGEVPVYDWPNPQRPRQPLQPDTPPNLLVTAFYVTPAPPFRQTYWPNPLTPRYPLQPEAPPGLLATTLYSAPALICLHAMLAAYPRIDGATAYCSRIDATAAAYPRIDGTTEDC
jgi:hypothetical protein